MPFLDAITVVAPTVRFSDFEIFATPTFCLARPFSILMSVAVHGRIVRVFFAISLPLLAIRRASYQTFTSIQELTFAEYKCAAAAQYFAFEALLFLNLMAASRAMVKQLDR
jgi:hypothetical protein